MIRQTMVAAIAAFGLVGGALAQGASECPCNPGQNTRVTGAGLSGLLSGRTVCAAAGNDSWQEFHQGVGSGTLIDWKLGPGHPVDPTGPVGTWSTNGAGVNATVTHSYGAGGSYTYTVCTEAAGTYRFCSGSTTVVTGATLISGQAACATGSPAGQGARPR